jgi:hypothetical protein
MRGNRPLRHILLALPLLWAVVPAAQAQLGGAPGAFSRLGFGARGIGMGNALTAVTDGDVTGYYNPAALAYAPYRHAGATAGFLSLDRSLNFLGFTQPLPPNAGLTVAIVNFGVSDIDGRDSDGEATGPLSTTENTVTLGFANRFKHFSLGVGIKLIYGRLYEGVSSTKFGVDAGIMVPATADLTLGASVRDIASKYTWETGELYGRNGNTTQDEFPRLYTVGASYRLPDGLGLVALDLEASSRSTLVLRVGAEAPVIPELTLRAGLDRIDLKEDGAGVKPAFGFTLRKELEGWTPALHYTFVVEPFSPSGMHLLSLSAAF